MRTAEEIRDANFCKPFPHLAVLSISDIQSIIDEAVAHGMTLSADCAISDSLMHHHDAEGRCICGNCSARRAILTARDNKVWRKTK